MGHAQQAFQQLDQARDDPARQYPCHHDEARDLPQQDEHPRPVQGVSELADGQPHHEQQQQFGDERGREHLDPDGLPQAVGVDQHLGEDAQAGQGQDARESQRAVEVEPQPEIVKQVQGDDQGGQEGDDDRDERGDEESSAQGRHESCDVDLVQTDEKEIEEDTEPQQDV